MRTAVTASCAFSRDRSNLNVHVGVGPRNWDLETKLDKHQHEWEWNGTMTATFRLLMNVQHYNRGSAPTIAHTRMTLWKILILNCKIFAREENLSWVRMKAPRLVAISSNVTRSCSLVYVTSWWQGKKRDLTSELYWNYFSHISKTKKWNSFFKNLNLSKEKMTNNRTLLVGLRPRSHL
jgi:hypothetical protein